MNKKKCLVIGYINNNLGDDLFFKILFERYPNVDFYFFPPAKLLKIYKRKYRKNKNIKFYDKEPYYKYLKRHHSLDVIDIFQLVKKAAENVDFYINIGGSIFIQNDDWKNDDRFIIKDIIKDKPSFIVGCNFGPGDKEYEKYYKEWFKKFDDVCFRDKESYNKFSDLKNTRLSDDIVLIDKKNYNKKQKKEKSVGISIINLNKKTNYKEHKEDYYNFIKKSIVDLLEENYQVNLFSFCENEGDLEAAKEIKNLLPKKDRKKIKIYNYKTSINYFLNKWNQNEYIIGTRFHAIILALANEQQFCSISYSKKTDNYLKLYNANIKSLNIQKLGNNKRKLKFYKISQEYNSEKQFEKIDEYLNIKEVNGMDYSKKPGQKVETIGKVLNNEKPTISVITPFYNGGKTLMETANALFSQTYPYFEWIIVDDGSKDEESLKKLAELEKMDKRIHVYHKENGGPSIARDYAISKASKDTKYLYFLDCDDIPSKTMIECLYWTLETHPDYSFAYTTMVNFGDREFLWEQYLTVERQMTENVICVSSLVKKADVLEVGGFGIKEKSMYEDWNLWLKLLQHGKKPIRVNAPLFWYRVSGTGEFSRANKNKEQAMKYVNETASKIEREVEIIQFPREGGQYDRVEQYDNMVVPQYEKDKKTKILYVFPWMVVGGADLFNLDLLKRIDKNKYSSIVVTTTPGSTDIRQEFEEHAECVYDMSTFLDRKAYINFVDYLIESRKVDVVVVSNTQYGYYMIPYLKGKYPNVAFIDYIHSIDLHDPREGFGKCTIDVNKYLTNTYVCNNYTKNQLKERYNKTKVETLYIGTDEKRFDPKKYDKKEIKQKYGIPEGRKVISFVARLSSEKRPTMFVKIAKKLLEKHSDLYFVIAGNGDLYHKVSKMITDDFKMLGMVKDTEEVYAMSDITINCSSLEGLALTSYESLAMNVPVISTDVGGQTELIDDKVGGIVHYNPGHNKELYEKEINEYVKETERVLKNLDSIKKNCRKKIESGFTIDIMIDKYQKIIDESIKKEKDKKPYELTYMVYDLALEILHDSYYLYCKHYYKTRMGMEYSSKKKPLLEGKAFKKKFKRETSFRKHYVMGEVNTILDCGRALKRTLIEGKVFAKFAIKSIPASIKFVIKMIIK